MGAIKRENVRYFIKAMDNKAIKGRVLTARVSKQGEMFMKFYFGNEQKYSSVDNVGGWEQDLLERGYKEVSKTTYYEHRKHL